VGILRQQHFTAEDAEIFAENLEGRTWRLSVTFAASAVKLSFLKKHTEKS